MSELVALYKEIAAIKRAMAQTFTDGTVEEVDPKKQRARLKIGERPDGKPILGPWVPYSQLAGAIKGHVPVSKGQQMTMFAPMGDFRRAILMPMTFSDENKSPSEKGDENVFTFGDFKITLKGKSLVAACGDKISLTVDESGAKIKVDGVEHTWTKDGIKQKVGDVTRELKSSGFEQTGGTLKHDAKSIGSGHTHSGIMRGGMKTDPPDA